MAEKITGAFEERVEESAPDSGHVLSPIATTDIDNYHGLNMKIVLVYFSINMITMAQILNLVGAGALSRDIAAVVGGSDKTVWLSQILGITTAVLSPPMSQAADLWGRKWLIVILTLLGCAGSIIIGRATSMEMAIAGQVIGGLAFGAQPLLYAVPSEIVPRRFRPMAQGGINMFIALGGIIALLAGFSLVKNDPAGFRTFWYITGALLGASALICAVLYNPPSRQLQAELTTGEKLRRLDWLGYLFLSSGIVLFSMALSWSQNPYSWTDVHILVPFVLGILLLLILAVHSIVYKKDGMFHHALFEKDRNFLLALICILVEGMTFFAAVNFLPYEASILFETDVVRVGLRFSIVFFTAIVSSAGIAVYSSLTRKIRLPTVLSFLFFCLFDILMATATLDGYSATWAYPIFLGIGLGICLTSLVTAAQLSAPPALIAITSGLLIGVRSLGGSIALPIYNAIFNSQIANHLGADVAAQVLPLGLPPTSLPAFITALAANDAQSLMQVPGVSPTIIEAGVLGLKQAFLKSFRYVWVAAGCFAFIASIVSCFFIDPTKDFTMHVDAPLDDSARPAKQMRAGQSA